MQKLNIKEFIEKGLKKHPGRYGYENVNYINSVTKVSITCYKHGDFLQTPSSHLQGQGCRSCQYSALRLKNRNTENPHIICKDCKIEKSTLEFNFRKESNRYRNNCKECQSKKQKQHRLKNLERINEKERQYRLKNGDKIRERERKSKKKNRETTNRNNKRKSKEDIFFKIKESIRKSIRRLLKKNNYKKESKTTEILGCSFEEFKKHIENQFEPWMNWENRGIRNLQKKTWELDHIIPMASAKTKEDVLRLNHYTNFQPLDGWENLKKSNKI